MTPVAPQTAASTSSGDNNEDLYIRIAIGASVAAFALGIIIGFCLFKCLASRVKQVEVVKTVEKFVPVDGLGNFHNSLKGIMFI